MPFIVMTRWVVLYGILMMLGCALLGDTIPIHTIQGTVSDDAFGRFSKSPLEGETVTVKGVIHQILLWEYRDVARYALCLQTLKSEEDDNPSSSEGLWVRLGNTLDMEKAPRGYKPEVGDLVLIEGTVRERYGMTELYDPKGIEILERGLDIMQVLRIPEIRPDPDAAKSGAQWEKVEGMHVKIPAPLQLTAGYKDGKLAVIDSSAPIMAFSNVLHRHVFRDPHPLDDVPDAFFDNENGYRIVLDDRGLAGAANTLTATFPPLHSFSQVTSDVYGTVFYSFGEYRVAASAPPKTILGPNPKNLTQLAPRKEDDLVVVTYNLENLYDAIDDPYDQCDFTTDVGNQRIQPPFNYVPANQAVFEKRVRQIARQIYDPLQQPDLILVQEVEDQDIFEEQLGQLIQQNKNHADHRLDCLQAIALEIKRLGGPEYRVANDRDAADDRGITCAFLYRADRLRLVRPHQNMPLLGSKGLPEFDRELLPICQQTQNPKAFNALYTYRSKESVIYSRSALLGLFEVALPDGSARRLFVLNNHFSSRPDKGIERRREQARFNAQLYQKIRELEPNAWVIMGGDLNVYPRPDDPLPKTNSDQLASLYEAGLLNVYDLILMRYPENAYSYIFQGQAQTLDHFFLSPPLASHLVFAQYVHLNADFPVQHDPDTLYGASDHDPLYLQFSF